MIAGNTRRKRSSKGFAEPMTLEQVDSLLAEAWLAEMVAKIRDGDEALKDSLPYICPHYARFKDNHRAQKDIEPEAFTFMTCVDVDDKELVDKAIQRAMEVNQDEYSDWQDQVLRIEYSARRKAHIYIRIPKGMTIEEAQQAFCAEIEVPFDESCITPERFIYVTGRDEEVYRSEHWLEAIPEKELEERREAYLQRGLDVDGRSLTGQSPSAARSTDGTVPGAVQENRPLEANERTRFIFRECMKECGLEPEVLIKEGGRHDAVKSILSVGATQLLKQEELLGVLSEMMPNNWQDENIQTLVNDFYQKYHDPSQKMTQFQRRVFAESLRVGGQSPSAAGSTDGTVPECTAEPTPLCTLGALFAAPQPPEIPQQLPKLVKAVTSSTPQKYKATVAQAMFPPLATYPRQLSFTYIDNQVRELRLNCLIVAGTGSGKDSCTKQPLTHIIRDMKERDELNRERLKKFNEEYNSKAQSKEKPKRPKDLIIQVIKSDITKAALVQRMDEAQGAPLYVRLNELELWDKIEGASGRSNQFTTLKLSDDEDNDFGSDRASTQSVMGSGSLHLNWTANTTPPKMIRYFRNVVTDGPISRLSMATIPDEEIGADIPIFGNYDEAYDEQLRPYIENLKEATGVIDCPQAKRLARRLKQECADFARLSQDMVFDNLTHRALVIVFRKACLLYAANGMRWEKSIETFCRWSLFYDLYLKMKFWGDMIRNAENDVTTSKRGPQSLLDFLPEEFTIEDARKLRLKRGMDVEGTEQMIAQWKYRGYINNSITDNSFKKVIRL